MDGDSAFLSGTNLPPVIGLGDRLKLDETYRLLKELVRLERKLEAYEDQAAGRPARRYDGSDLRQAIEEADRQHREAQAKSPLSYLLDEVNRLGIVSVVSDDPRIAEDAEDKLHLIRIGSEWHAARYAAEKALGTGDKELKESLLAWRFALEDRLYATKEVPDIKRVDVYEKQPDSTFKKVGQEPERVVENIPDEKLRLMAVEDVAKLSGLTGEREFKEILLAAYRYNDVGKVRMKAGKELGYRSLRILAHEDPVTAVIVGVGAACTAALFAQYLAQCLGK